MGAAEVARARIKTTNGDMELRANALKAGRFGTWTLDLSTLELTTSSVCRENFGRAPDAPFSYLDLQAAVHPDDQQRMRTAVADVLVTGELNYHTALDLTARGVAQGFEYVIHRKKAN